MNHTPLCRKEASDFRAVESKSITRITSGVRSVVQDILAVETCYALSVNETETTRFNCLPQGIEDLAVGHCFTRGWITHPDQVAHVSVDHKKREICLKTRHSSNSFTTVHEDFTVRQEDILRLKENFENLCDLYRLTGATHSCALADLSGVILYREDIARHNALDKLIGAMLRLGIDTRGKVMYFSGRLAQDMLEKASSTGIRLLISPGAPTLLAVEMAEAKGICLLGFVRKDNINIYTFAERVL